MTKNRIIQISENLQIRIFFFPVYISVIPFLKTFPPANIYLYKTYLQYRIYRKDHLYYARHLISNKD